MEKIIIACLVLNIIIFALLLSWVVIMGKWHFEKDKRHDIEREELKQSRDYHIKELVKRSGNENVDLH